MSFSMSRLFVVPAVIVAAAILLFGAPAYAQRDAGAKARGEFGTGFWNSPRRATTFYAGPVQTYRSYSYEPRVETYRSFSYEPGLSTGADAAQDQPQVEVYSYPPSYRSYGGFNAPLKAPWLYPKSDPRRYTSSRR
jgi:hypothetical protein